jgi:Ca2+-binding EF-hand superfamily protein
MFVDPEEAENRRRLTAFYAADIDGNGELNMNQYLSAMDALGYSKDKESELRVYFDEADTDSNGIIDIDEFLASVARHESSD